MPGNQFFLTPEELAKFVKLQQDVYDKTLSDISHATIKEILTVDLKVLRTGMGRNCHLQDVFERILSDRYLVRGTKTRWGTAREKMFKHLMSIVYKIDIIDWNPQGWDFICRLFLRDEWCIVFGQNKSSSNWGNNDSRETLLTRSRTLRERGAQLAEHSGEKVLAIIGSDNGDGRGREYYKEGYPIYEKYGDNYVEFFTGDPEAQFKLDNLVEEACASQSISFDEQIKASIKDRARYLWAEVALVGHQGFPLVTDPHLGHPNWDNLHRCKRGETCKQGVARLRRRKVEQPDLLTWAAV